MNHLLKKFEQECTTTVWVPGSGTNVSFNKEKFAELIVNECAELFRLVHTDEKYPRRIDKTILKHFEYLD